MSNFNSAGQYIPPKKNIIFNTVAALPPQSSIFLKPTYTHYCQTHGLLKNEIISFYIERFKINDTYCMLCLKELLDKWVSKATKLDDDPTSAGLMELRSE